MTNCLFFSETSLTGQLPERPEGMSDLDYKKWVCANAINDWANLMLGSRPPANFGPGMAIAADFLGVAGVPESFSEYADNLLKLK
jgi:hypothetical protein